MTTRTKKQRAFRFGLLAELVGVVYLSLQGWRIIARRYRNPWGEIDLIARRGSSLAFIEVKARATREAAAESLGPVQRSRIVRAAQGFLAANPSLQSLTPRFDVMVVGTSFWPRYIRGAFHAET